MLVKNCIYYIIIGINLLSIPILIYSIMNKNKNICKDILIIDIIYMMYLFITNIIMIQSGILDIEYGLEVLLLHFMSIIAAIIYIISIIICCIMKKKNKDEKALSNKIKSLVIMLIMIPILFFFIVFYKERYFISNSDLVLVYYSSGNGGFGDGETFAYAVNDDYCEQISLGTSVFGYDLKKLLPKNAKEITNIEDLENYEITFNETWEDNSIIIHKDNKYICKKKNKSNYFNIKFERAYYLNHN